VDENSESNLKNNTDVILQPSHLWLKLVKEAYY